MSIHGPIITIEDLDETYSVTLTDKNAPHPIPRIKKPYQVLEKTMNDGAGVRTLQVAGTHISWGNIEFSVKLLESDQVAALDSLFDARPASRLKFTLDGGVTWYRAIFADNGWDPDNWAAPNWDKQSGKIRLKVTGVLA